MSLEYLLKPGYKAAQAGMTPTKIIYDRFRKEIVTQVYVQVYQGHN
jgi:hypothetical protein